MVQDNSLFFASSGIQFPESNNQFHYHHTMFSSQLKSRVGHILDNVATLHITLSIDVTPIHTSSTHLQEFSLRIQTVDFSTVSVWCSPPTWNQRLTIHHTRKHLETTVVSKLHTTIFHPRYSSAKISEFCLISDFLQNSVHENAPFHFPNPVCVFGALFCEPCLWFAIFLSTSFKQWSPTCTQHTPCAHLCALILFLLVQYLRYTRGKKHYTVHHTVLCLAQLLSLDKCQRLSSPRRSQHQQVTYRGH
jgi:hypothetical protein